MTVYFADRKMNILECAATGLAAGFLIRKDTKTDEIGAGAAAFSFDLVYPADERTRAEEITAPGNYLLRSDGEAREFYTIIESELNTDACTVSVWAEGAGLDLLNEIAVPYEADQAQPAAFYIEKFAYDSGFEIGRNEISDRRRRLKWDGECTVTERLASVAAQFGAELEFSFEIKGLRVLHKYIHLLKRRGGDYGVRLRRGIEVGNISVRRSAENLATALKVTGGVPQGAQGIHAYDDANGKPYYTWVKYADSPTAGMTDRAAGKDYIGLAYGKPDSSESEKYSDYTWTKVRRNKTGVNGQPLKTMEYIPDTGVLQPNGKYTWVKYADNSAGGNLSDSPAGKRYIGLAYDKPSRTESARAADYHWSLIKGDDAQPVTLRGYVYDDGDFFLEGTFLKSREAVRKWSRYLWENGTYTGHLMRTFSYNTTDQAELCARALEALRRQREIQVNYEIELRALPENVRVGDTVSIVDSDGALYLSARVLRLESSVADNVHTATLGDYLIRDDGISERLHALADQVEQMTANRAVFTWIAYADDAYGSEITTDPSGKDYIGVAVNRAVPDADLSDPSVFAWSRIKGEQGIQGEPGISAAACDSGAGGVWTYEKYEDGRLRCVGRIPVCTDVNAAFGNMYQSGPAFDAASYAYPAAFAGTPAVHLTFAAADHQAAQVWLSGAGTETQPPDCLLVRPVSASAVTGTISVTAEGRWR